MTRLNESISKKSLAEECQRLGVECIGTTELVNQEGELVDWYLKHSTQLLKWLKNDQHADMVWMETQADKRCDPRLLLPGVRTAVALWLSHHFETPENQQTPPVKVARYAWGRDYHNVLRRVLRQLGKWLSNIDPTVRFHGSVDTSPVLERAIGERCGVGWIGKSTMLIHPQRGTFGSIAIFLTSAIFDDSESKPHPFRCGTCNDCIEACPTQALGPQGLDARKCISYWTIEHRGMIPKHMRAAIGEWVFGCDICQDICPWTMKAERLEAYAKKELWQPIDQRARPDLSKWLRTSDEELTQQLQGSPLKRAFPHGLKRNALIVLANLRCFEAIPLMIEQLEHSHFAVRASAAWALGELGEYKPSSSMEFQIKQHLQRILAYESSAVVMIELKESLNRL